MIKSANSVLASTDNRLISRYQYWFLAAITLLPFVLRFYKLGEWSFWIDEYVTIKHSHNLTWSSSLLFGRKLSYLFIKLALLFFGESEWTARFIPALIGLISIPLLYWIVKKFFDLPIAIFCATLLAISPWHIYWSQNARFYTQFLLFYNISIFSFYIGLEQDKSIYYIASLLAFFLLSYRIKWRFC
jgi:mannosyltransferase